MAKVSDLSLGERIWYHRYRFRQVDPLPWSPSAPPLEEARVAVVTTAGVHLPDDEPFEKVKGGDFSYRIIPGDTDPSTLVVTHPSDAWDRSGVEEEMNTVVPLDHLRKLAEEGVIGKVAPRHISFQGSITAPGRLTKKTAPEVAEILADDGVHVVVLTPV
jgi:D-proline reductase (dithiol) PrdB